jgi:hypothetical protein
MRVGFTGTRTGMTTAQLRVLMEKNVYMTHGFHGACAGADREFHKWFPDIRMDLYPSDEPQHKWAFENCKGGKDIVHPIYPPLVRNRMIVDAVQLMFAAPSSYIEQKRGSGTWATIRYARLIQKPLIILWTDGKTREEFM